MITIQEAKEYLRSNWEKNDTYCPCCNQKVKLYPRPIHHSMAVCLIRLYKLCVSGDPATYHHVNEFGADGTRGGDFAKLKYWGLTAEKSKDENDDRTRTSGYWAITQKGKDFVLDKITVNKRIYIYDSKKVMQDEEQVSIRHTLGKKFNYGELMEGYL